MNLNDEELALLRHAQAVAVEENNRKWHRKLMGFWIAFAIAATIEGLSLLLFR